MEEDTRLASLEQPVMAYGAGTPSFSSYHGTQTETGNHGRMGKGPKHTWAGTQAAVRKESPRTIYLFSRRRTARSSGVVFPRLLTFYGPDFQALIFST